MVGTAATLARSLSGDIVSLQLSIYSLKSADSLESLSASVFNFPDLYWISKV